MWKERVAVGLCGRSELGADLARCAGLSLDYHRLFDQWLQQCRERTPDQVGGAAGWERVNEGDGSAG